MYKSDGALEANFKQTSKSEEAFASAQFLLYLKVQHSCVALILSDVPSIQSKASSCIGW